MLEVRHRRHESLHVERTVRTQPKRYMPEELETLGQRLREASRRINDARDNLTASLGDLEEAFFDRLGSEIKARVALRTNRDGYIEHLVFREGFLWIEHGRPGRPLQRDPIRDATIERRLLACYKIRDLWKACGGATTLGV